MNKLKYHIKNLMIYVSFLIQASFVFIALLFYPIDLIVRLIHRTKFGRITKDELIKDYLMVCESLRDCMEYSKQQSCLTESQINAKEEGNYKKDTSDV